MRDKLPQKSLHSSPPRLPLSLISLPSSTLSSFILTSFFKSEDLVLARVRRSCALNDTGENGNGNHSNISPLLIISLTSSNIIVHLIQCRFYQNWSMTLKSSWVRAEIWQLGCEETSRPDDEEIVTWRAELTAQPHNSVTFLAKLINRTTESFLSDQQQQMSLLFSTSYVPYLSLLNIYFYFFFTSSHLNITFLHVYLLSRSSRVGRIFISVNFSEYCHPVQDDHSIPSA